MNKLSKILSVGQRKCIQIVMYISTEKYMKYYLSWLKKKGMIIQGTPSFISNDVHFDGADYSLITLGDGCTISREVLFLTHDFSMHTALRGLRSKLPQEVLQRLERKDAEDKLLILKSISVGNFSFIGARVTLLPGTQIGNNCIVGSGSVVKGVIPDNSIVLGNPARIYSNTDSWLIKKSDSLYN